jgi:hypothetical protein
MTWFFSPWSSVSTNRANRKTGILHHLPLVSRLGMLVFDSPCPNPDTDTFEIRRDVARGSEAAVFTDRVPQITMIDEHADPLGRTCRPGDVLSHCQKVTYKVTERFEIGNRDKVSPAG